MPIYYGTAHRTADCSLRCAPIPLNTGLYLATAGASDQAVVLWDVNERKCLEKRLLPGSATGLAWHPSNNALAIITEDGELHARLGSHPPLHLLLRPLRCRLLARGFRLPPMALAAQLAVRQAPSTQRVASARLARRSASTLLSPRNCLLSPPVQASWRCGTV